MTLLDGLCLYSGHQRSSHIVLYTKHYAHLKASAPLLLHCWVVGDLKSKDKNSRASVAAFCRGGRVVTAPKGPAEPVPGLYVCGWVKRGPSGIIGASKCLHTTLLGAEEARCLRFCGLQAQT